MNLIQRLATVILFAIVSVPAAAQDHWVASWGAGSVKLAGEVVPEGGVTYRNIVHLSLGGKQLRVTLSNRFGAEPLKVEGVSAAPTTPEGIVKAGTLRPVTFGGKPGTIIAPGAVVMSDPVSIAVPPLGDLAVSVFLPAQTISFFTGHAVTHAQNYRAVGNQLEAASLPDAANSKPWRTVTAVDVMAPARAAAIVAFGDSITAGTGTTNNTNRRYPNLLAARLQADPRHANLAVVDEGIGGNRILHDGGQPDARAGEHQSGISRWSYDALDRAGVKYVILLEGVNDLGRSSILREGKGGQRQAKSPEEPVTAAELIAAMTKMIDAAHKRGIKVIGATMTPYEGANYFRPDGGAAREEINKFIRTGGKFDGVIDFEKAVGDPAKPTVYRAGFNDSDHLHPNDAGAKAMADSIDLSMFK